MDLSEPVFDYFSIGVTGSMVCSESGFSELALLYVTYRDNPDNFHSTINAFLWEDYRSRTPRK